MLNKIITLITKNYWPKVFVEKDISLAGQVIVITGASHGVGRACTQLALDKGAKVVLVAREESEMRKMYLANNNVLTVRADVAKFDQCLTVVSQAMAKFGRIDAVLNIAGTFSDKSIDQTSSEEFERVMQINVGGVFNMCRAVTPWFKKQGNGTIINMGSKISHNTAVAPNKVTYATSKYAVEGLSYALNRELKPFGIRVCCLMPGTVATFFSKKGNTYLSPFEVAKIVQFIIEMKSVDFESMIFKSVRQNI